MKEAQKNFPMLSEEHNFAFESIVCNANCLMVINHMVPGDNKIFVTCDTRSWRTGMTLSFGPTWEMA